MKLSFLKLRTRSFLKSNKSLRVNLPYKQAVNVGILFTAEDKSKHEETKELVKKLELDGKQVEVMSFLPKDKENIDFLYDFFTEKDISFWGKITSTSVNNFLSIPFDFLFYMDNDPNPFLMNILAQSKAKCRVGKFWNKSENFFELMIESTNNRSLVDSMYKYTSILK